MELEISFEEALKGTKKTVAYSKNTTCSECNGSGAKPGVDPIECSTCK